MSSPWGKYKAFSTYAPHLSVVSLFYCTALGVYLSSAASYSYVCDIHSGHTHVKPLHLQSEEQRHKEGSKKNHWSGS